MADRQETPLSLVQKVLSTSLEEAEEDPHLIDDLDRLDLFKVVLQGPNLEERFILRRLLASGMAQMDGLTAALQGTALIAARNLRALEILQNRLQQGDQRLALFYGAAHMDDFEERLKALGYRFQKQGFVTAWSLQQAEPWRPAK